MKMIKVLTRDVDKLTKTDKDVDQQTSTPDISSLSYQLFFSSVELFITLGCSFLDALFYSEGVLGWIFYLTEFYAD